MTRCGRAEGRGARRHAVTKVGIHAFYGCTSLASLAIRKNSQITEIGSSAFYGCTSLVSLGAKGKGSGARRLSM